MGGLFSIMFFKAADSLTEQIAQHLANKIITGKLKSRERIQELKIAHELDVSRGSVREALLLLQRRHLIDILPRRGAMVSDLTEHKIRCLYAMVENLYTMLAVELAGKWKELHQLKPFEVYLERLKNLAREGNVEEFVKCSFVVIDLANNIVKNPYLAQILNNLQPAIHRTYHLALSRREEELEQSLNFFNQILIAIMQRDLTRIEQLVREYAHSNRDLILAIMSDEHCASEVTPA